MSREPAILAWTSLMCIPRRLSVEAALSRPQTLKQCLADLIGRSSKSGKWQAGQAFNLQAYRDASWPLLVGNSDYGSGPIALTFGAKATGARFPLTSAAAAMRCTTTVGRLSALPCTAVTTYRLASVCEAPECAL